MEPGGPVRLSYAEVNFVPPVRDYEYGYCTQASNPEFKFRKKWFPILKRENHFFVKRDKGVCMIDLQREICKPGLKLDFTAHGITEYLSEFGLSNDSSRDFS
jgi:hypothetical protein